MMNSLHLTLPTRFLLLIFLPCVASGLQLHHMVLQAVGCEPLVYLEAAALQGRHTALEMLHGIHPQELQVHFDIEIVFFSTGYFQSFFSSRHFTAFFNRESSQLFFFFCVLAFSCRIALFLPPTRPTALDNAALQGIRLRGNVDNSTSDVPPLHV